MGFTSWPYGPKAEDVANTYSFIAQNADIYAEHIDSNIPWNAWMSNSPLPANFVNDISFKKSNKIPEMQMLLSVSVLNLDRNDLANDYSGNPPPYNQINDSAIVDAYTKHVDYLVREFSPDYLVISIEANELLKNSPGKWDAYKLMIAEVKSRISVLHPSLPISESVTLHNFFQPDVADPDTFIEEVTALLNRQDFAAISFYPFFKLLNTEQGFQEAFDFLHSKAVKPIAFVETAHLAEDLLVPGLNLNIPGNEAEQNSYLQILLKNAQEENYDFVIWWAYRDFDALWETFPSEVKDLGQIWRDTGLMDEDGRKRMAFDSWNAAFLK